MCIAFTLGSREVVSACVLVVIARINRLSKQTSPVAFVWYLFNPNSNIENKILNFCT